jgi:heterotetrameric sarcosine oxidase gamma subunit
VPEMLYARSALHGVMIPGRYGKATAAPGVTIAERIDLGLATVAARKGKADALAVAVRSAYGADLPWDSRVVAGQTAAFIGTAPGQWLAMSERLANGALADELAAKLAGLASITDQSDGRAVVRVSGPRARDALAKGVPIDLHPSVFGPGSAATTVISLIGAQIWQVDEAPTYDIAAFRGFAASLLRWITSSAAEFGYTVVSGG